MSSKKETNTFYRNKLTTTMAAINSPRNMHFASRKLPISSTVCSPPQRQLVNLDTMVGLGGVSFENDVTARMYSESYGAPYNYQRYIGYNEGASFSANAFERSNNIDDIHPDNFVGTEIFSPNQTQHSQQQLAEQQSPFDLTNDNSMAGMFDSNILGRPQHSQTHIQYRSPFELGSSINSSNSGDQQQIFMDVSNCQIDMEPDVPDNLQFKQQQTNNNPFMNNELINNISSQINSNNNLSSPYQVNPNFSEIPSDNMLQQITSLVLEMDEGDLENPDQQNGVSNFQSAQQNSFDDHPIDNVPPNFDISTSTSTWPENDSAMVEDAELEFSEEPRIADGMHNNTSNDQTHRSSLDAEESRQPPSSGRCFRGSIRSDDEDLELPDEIFDSNGDTFLHKAIHNHDIEQCLEILQVEVLKKAINLKNKSNEVPLLLLLKKCLGICTKAIKKLFDLGVKVNVTDLSGNNMFHIAVAEARSEDQCLNVLNICFLYEQYKEQFNILLNNRNALGLTATHIATAKCYCKVVQLLHKHGANLDLTEFQDKKTCIVIAAENGRWNMVKELVRMNANVNIATNTDLRAINYAIIASQREIIELLFEKGTDVYKWKDKAPSEEIKMLVAKLIRRKQRRRRAERDG